MRIAIASGKGGTGKTTVAVSLAITLAELGESVAFLDCDVEEPNGHIFLNPEIQERNPVTIPVPEVDESRCTYCRVCSEACRFSALMVLQDKVLVFPSLCHGCGGCTLVCPVHAIREVGRPMGAVEKGRAGKVGFVSGRLDIGEAMAPPVIRAVKVAAPDGHTWVMDCPPGTSCPVIESVKGADVVLLVTEPTPFGLSDLKLAVQMVRALGLPFAVAVNRVGVGDREVFRYCDEERIPILLELPDDRKIAEAYSRGELVVDAAPELKPLFVELAESLRELASGPRPAAVDRSELEERSDPEEDRPSEMAQPGQAGAVQEVVVISGKGGTGKTSLVASFFALSEGAVVADCDVDAADLHLVLDPEVRKQWLFTSGAEACVDPNLCVACGMCEQYCRFDAIRIVEQDGRELAVVDPLSCEGCGVCAEVCPTQAPVLATPPKGEWFVSRTRHGPMIHARLGIAQENSGKLVSLVRREAKAVAESEGCDLLLTDGSPGTGCPVIASVTGAQMVLVVGEPTLSGLHDMKRVAELIRHFELKGAVCINKADINVALAEQLEVEAGRMGLSVLGRIRYDPAVTQAQVRRTSVVENGNDGPVVEEIRALWARIKEAMN